MKGGWDLMLSKLTHYC